MKKALLTALAIATVSAPMVAAPAADAQRRDRDRDYQWHGDRDDWDASRDYRRGKYRERRLSREDQVYRGRDGRSYCKRNDGTTGLIAGGAAGGILGNVIDGGHSRIVGTLLGGAVGALAGKAIDQNQAQVRCR